MEVIMSYYSYFEKKGEKGLPVNVLIFVWYVLKFL